MTQRQVALAVAAAILVGLLLAAVVVGLFIGAAVRSVAGDEGPVQVRTEQPASIAELEEGYELGTGALEVDLAGVDFSEDTTALAAHVDASALTVVMP